MHTRFRRLVISLLTLISVGAASIGTAFAAEPTLSALTLAPGSATLAAGQQTALTLTGTFSDASVATVTEQATWTTNGGGFTGIPGQKGVFTANAQGTWMVTATLGSLSASATITITPGAPAQLTLMPTPATVTAGAVMPLRLFAVDAFGNGWDVTSSAQWTTTEPTGVVLATGYQAATPGNWQVRATLGALTVTRDVTVHAGSVESIQLVPKSTPTVIVGKTLQLQVHANDARGNLLTPIFQWAVTNPSIGSISADGVFTAENPGQTNIIVSADGAQEIFPIIVQASTQLNPENDPGIVAVNPTNTTPRTPRVAAEEIEVQPNPTAQTPATTTSSEPTEKNIPHPWVIVLLCLHGITLIAYFAWLMRKPTRWWWIAPIATTAILLALYSSLFVAATYLWWPWTILGMTILFISVYYQRYGPGDGPPQPPPSAAPPTQ